MFISPSTALFSTLVQPVFANSDHGSATGSVGHTKASMSLVALEDVTHRAVQAGDWSDPATWENGLVPTQWAKVHIPEAVDVRVDGLISASMKTVRVDGTLNFANDVNTELKVDTLVTGSASKLIIGTPEAPITPTVSAKLTIADDGAIDRSWDPAMLSRGLLAHGETTIYGAEKSAFHTLAQHPVAGASEITLSEVPTGWAVGDILTIAGTEANQPDSDEKVTIASIEGSTIVLENPVVLDHVAPNPSFDVHVANLSRNIEISSENDAVLHRGHIMFMHTNDVDMNFASVTNMGRTDKSKLLDDWVLISENEGSIGAEHVEVEDLGGNNVRGRYALHFHRGGTDQEGEAGLVNGVVVQNVPGWGYVNHSSNVEFTNNVSYDVTGAAFNTEAGDEIGAFRGNIALRTFNPDANLNPTLQEIDPEQEPDARLQAQDYGWQGDGFWLHGAGVEMQDNVVSGASGHGYMYWSLGLVEKGMGERLVDVANLPSGDLIGPNGTMVRTKHVPVPLFDNNDAYATTKGLQVHYLHTDDRDEGDRGFEEEGLLATVPQAYEDQLLSTFANSTYWNVSKSAVDVPYSGRIALENITALGTGEEASIGVRLDHFASENGLSLSNSDIRGFQGGVTTPREGIETLLNLTLANQFDLGVYQPLDALDEAILQSIDFVDPPAFLDPDERETVVRLEEEDLEDDGEAEIEEDEAEEQEEGEEEEADEDEDEEEEEDADAILNFIEGTEGHDHLVGTAEHDEISGGKGRDKLIGKLGDDELFGDAGRDVLKGGPGDDYLDGGAGRDAYRGGQGDDIFVLGPDKRDVVRDYQPESDLLDVSGWGVESLEELDAVSKGDGWLVFVADNPKISALIKTDGETLSEDHWQESAFIFADTMD